VIAGVRNPKTRSVPAEDSPVVPPSSDFIVISFMGRKFVRLNPIPFAQ
jgi:hypothetical protein